MNATFVELRTRSAQVLKALQRKERVTVFYRGKPAAIMEPIGTRKVPSQEPPPTPPLEFGPTAPAMSPRNCVNDAGAASVLFDTDVLIWCLRGNVKAARAVDEAPTRSLSVVSYMDLLQGARDKREVLAIRSFLSDLAFHTLPLTENIGHRAATYMEEYGLSTAMGVSDALIVATATEAALPLLTGNDKHYRVVKNAEVRRFRP